MGRERHGGCEGKEIELEGWKGGWVEVERGMSKVKVKVHLI